MTRRTSALTATVVLLAFPASGVAKPKSSFTIRGAGWGHGVGMSQWGAYGFARHGFGHVDILKHYYTGTEIGRTDPQRSVRVLLQSARTLRFTGAAQAGSRTLDPAKSYAARRSAAGNVDLLSAQGKKLGTFAPPLQLAGPAGSVVLKGRAANGRSDGAYRGILELKPSVFGRLMAVNTLSLEDYVKGVIPLESPASWPAEALKAQAVAARSYAITTGGGADFDQFADTRSQMYGGLGAETPATDLAADETRAQVVTYRGTPVTTFFFSASGGRTESVENTSLGSSPRPWLVSVPDPYDGASPRHRWGPIKLTLTQAQRKLHGLVEGRFRGIRVERRGASPRIIAAQVIGTKGVTEVTGAALRARFGLFDTWAFFTTITAGEKPPAAPPAPAPQALDPSGGAAARAARGGGRVAGVLAGTVIPARRGAPLKVQVLRGRRWAPAGSAVVGRGGRYAFAAPAAGRYRVVLASGEAGPDARVG